MSAEFGLRLIANSLREDRENSQPRYTLAELSAAASEYVTELEKKTRMYQTMLRLDLSHFMLWLAKREQGKVRDAE